MSRKKPNPAFFHKLYGEKQPKVTYYGKDFPDYLLMILLSALVVGFSYKSSRPMSMAGFALCAVMPVVFAIRHGIGFGVPVVLRKPQEVLYTLIYKLGNLKPIYFIALGLLLLENFLIARTPDLSHHVELMRKIGLYLFYAHFLFITAYRTAILIDHLAKKELVREVLMQTPWRRVIREKTNITLEIVHSYFTGVLTHLVSIAPWYLVIARFKFSAIFLPIVCLINIGIQMKWYKVFNAWFYRDHWLGHNSEFDFVFLHGPHHDAIPTGMIAVAENGILEGFLRFAIGAPVPFFNPIVSFLTYTFDIKTDIELHQYIPGIFPRMSRMQVECAQHSTHHYGPLEPYSLGSKEPDYEELRRNVRDFKKTPEWVPDELKNSIRLDEELTGFKWDNATHRKTLSLWDKYQA